MSRLPREHPNSAFTSPSPCECSGPSWRQLADLSYELWTLREQLHEDRVEHGATQVQRAYALMGDGSLELGAARHRTRLGLDGVDPL